VTLTADEGGDPVAGVAVDDVRGARARSPSTHLLGLALSFVGVVLLSPDALIIRTIRETPSTILFWRALLTALSLLVLAAVMNRGRLRGGFRAIGRIGLLVAAFHAGGNIAFVTAVTNTSVANTLVIISTAPLFAALLSRAFLGERIPLRTWVAIGTVVGAVTLVFAGSLQAGGLFGDLVALGGSLSSAATITTIRHARRVSMVPAMVLAAGITCLVALAFGAGVPHSGQVGLMVLQGSLLLPAAIALIATAPRFLPAPEVSLITRLEMILGPIWVWLFLHEAPSVAAIVSGIVILVTLTVHTALGLRTTDGPSLPR
jgi:drug/metabolite transporter (DMT)-like permease